jgi:hypothetical protein
VVAARSRLEGWPIVGWAVLALGAGFAGILVASGADEEGIRTAIRATARSSLVLFSAASAASSLRRLRPGPATAWLLRNRRQLGVSFGVSHALHALGIALLAARFGDRFQPEPPTLVFGGLGYALAAAMVATSFDRSAAWLGRRRWRALHTTGIWYLSFIFAQNYAFAALRSPLYLALAVLALGTPALRIAVAVRDRRRRAAAALRS